LFCGKTQGENETDYRYVCYYFCIIIIYLFVCVVSMHSGVDLKSKEKFSGKVYIESELELYDLGVAVMFVVIFV